MEEPSLSGKSLYNSALTPGIRNGDFSAFGQKNKKESGKTLIDV
jgi:hypothetical protein